MHRSLYRKIQTVVHNCAVTDENVVDFIKPLSALRTPSVQLAPGLRNCSHLPATVSVSSQHH